MTLKEFEAQLTRLRAQGANDDTIVQGFESQDRLNNDQKHKYFTIRDLTFGQRSQEHGGGHVIRIYHYTV